MLSKDLQKLGLSKNEAEVYLALLEIGFTTTGPIIKKTGLHRNIVYETLDKLLAQGLVSFSVQRGKKHFRVLSPEKLLREQKSRLSLAQSIVPQLINLQKKEKQEIVIYEGKEGFQNAHLDVIRQMKKNSTIYVMIAGGERWFDSMGNTVKKFDRLRTEKNIRDKVIALESQRKDLGWRSGRPLFEVRFLPEKFDNPSGTAIYDDITLIMVYGEPVLAMTIKNHKIAKAFKQYFDMLWKMARK